LNLILLAPDEIDASGHAALSGARARHLIQVLRAARGQHVRVGIIDGPLGTAAIVDHTGDRVTLACSFDGAVPDRPAVDLLLALPRPKVMRRLWAQLAAIGVGRIILTNAERVERNYFDTHVLRPEVYRPLLLEGLQQARDTRVPAVSIHRRFRVLIEDELSTLAGDLQRIVADPSGRRRMGDSVGTGGERRVLLAVGPEGGWNRFEIEFLEAHGFQVIGAGTRTLRSDTACVALLAIAHEALG
jgi:RsmE family RNA methyltransferase